MTGTPEVASTVAVQVGTAAVELLRISKRYPGVQALDEVSLEVRAGEIHALVGENGAGKSTLVGCLAGLVRPDAGELLIDGRPVALHSPRDARAIGITVVPQEPLAVPTLSAGRNVLLGLEARRTRRGRLGPDERDRVMDALVRCGASFDPDTRAGDLSVPEVRLIQIARTLVSPGDVVVLDEPTAVLSESDAEALLERLVGFKNDGKAILYVSHRLGEVLRTADRVSVLRDGRHVGTFATPEIDRARLIRLMVKDVRNVPFARDHTRAVAEPTNVLHVDGLVTDAGREGVTFTAGSGEIVGIAGVQGAGQGALLRALAGLSRPAQGRVVVDGKEITTGSARAAYAAGIVLVPADRRGAAIVPQLSVQDNLALPAKTRAQRLGFRLRREEARVTRAYVERFDVRAAGIFVSARTLSGGNQQKLALARALESDPRVLLLEEPTQGIDVAAKAQVLGLIRELSSKGDRAIVVASSEFEELLELADVIHVMCLGRMAATLTGSDATYENILHEALP